MLNELFRFSIIRGAELHRKLHPIRVGKPPTQHQDRTGEKLTDLALTILHESDQTALTVLELQKQVGISNDENTDRLIKGLIGNGTILVRDTFSAFRNSPIHSMQFSFHEACRYLTAAELLFERDTAMLALSIHKWIDIHPIQIDFDLIIGAGAWVPSKALVRPAAIMEHFVVREKLIGYEMGQIEDIKNYLKGELKDHSLRFLKIDEEEVVDERQTDEFKSSETSTQQRSTLSASAQNTANSTLGVDARVQTSGQYGPTRVDTNLGFQYTSAASEARQSASEFVTEVMQKTVEEVRQKELKRITRRRRTELEENRQHKVDNVGGDGHVIGIYRWVDSVWEAKTYKIGVRLVLELLIPQPGKAILQEAENPKEREDLPPKPAAPPSDLFDQLTDSKAAEYASRYGAEGVVAAPLQWLTVGSSFQSPQLKDDAAGSRAAALSVKELKVPKEYVGKVLYVAVTTMRAMDADNKINIAISAPGLHPEHFDDNAPSDSPFYKNPVYLTDSGNSPDPDTTVVILRKTHDNLASESTVPITIYTEDVRGITGYAELRCERSEKALNDWKLDTCAKIFAAYRTRLAEWDSLKAAKQFTDLPPRKQLDIQALSRHVCISSLLGTLWPSAANLHKDSGWPKEGALANPNGLMIEFMEQAFEWHNLQYVAYPYYWSDETRWAKLLDVNDNDPKAQELLRAGAVRYVIPVRIEMTEAVQFFLATGVPYLGGGAPAPGTDGYLPIADEIKQSRTAASKEDELTNTFKFKLPTNLSILQEDGVLPEVNP